MGEFTPPLIVPELGKYLWDWYGQINSAVSRIHDGVCKLIPPSEYLAWFTLSDVLVSPKEYDILQSMDIVYCEETNKEFQSQRNKREEEMARQVEEARQKGKKRG